MQASVLEVSARDRPEKKQTQIIETLDSIKYPDSGVQKKKKKQIDRPHMKEGAPASGVKQTQRKKTKKKKNTRSNLYAQKKIARKRGSIRGCKAGARKKMKGRGARRKSKRRPGSCFSFWGRGPVRENHSRRPGGDCAN